MKRAAFLLSELIRRDLTARFAGSFGGPLWAILNPLVFGLLYGYVFSVVLKTTPPPGFRGGYAEFLLAGLLPWLGFSEAVSRGSSSVVDQAHLVKKLRFPLELLVASTLGAALVLETVAVTLLAVWVLATGGAVQPLYLAGAFVFQALLLAGPILALAALQVVFRDLAQVLSPALTVTFYLTPILYPESLIPAGYVRWLALNPVRDMVALFRTGLFGTAPPPSGRLAIWCAVFVVIAFLAERFFRRSSRSFSDLL